MNSVTKKCETCNESKPLSDYYTAPADGAVAWTGTTKFYGFPDEDIEFLKNKARADYDKTRLSLEMIANDVRRIDQFGMQEAA